MTVQGVIFDYKTLLLEADAPKAAQASRMLWQLRERDLRWCLFTTDPLSNELKQRFEHLGYPEPDLLVDLTQIPSGKRRGSPDWIDVVTNALGIHRHQLLYVGCSTLDWRTAINSGVLYLHANWAARQPGGTTSLTVESPLEVPSFFETFLATPPAWAYGLDQGNWKLRSLLPASAILPCTSPRQKFTLQDVFTYDKAIKVNDEDARDLLMLFVLSNAYLEGLIPANPVICVYPGSKRGKVSLQLADYLDRAAKLFHGYYKDDLLVRASDAIDTSLERVNARKKGRTPNVSIATQAATVHLGERYRGRLTGRSVIVFDDFTTNGMSLEWARLLLSAAGAGRIVMLTVGKYGTSHYRYDLRSGIRLDPFTLNTLSATDFVTTSRSSAVDNSVVDHMGKLMESLIMETRRSP